MRRFVLLVALLAWVPATPCLAETRAQEPVIVPFDLLFTKHMVIQIKINGKGSYRVIFDTGAPVSVINSKIAKETGLLAKNSPMPLFSLFGPAAPATIKELEIGALKAQAVPVIVMDHPTVEVIAEIAGPVEGILGFPFFARYKMTLDYQAKQLTFAPSSYEPSDILQTLMSGLLAGDKPATKLLAPAGLWGVRVAKEGPEDASGVTIKDVLAGSAAAKAGLQAGDRLLSLDGRWTDSLADCYAAAATVPPGREVRVVIERGGEERTLRVTPQAGL